MSFCSCSSLLIYFYNKMYFCPFNAFLALQTFITQCNLLKKTNIFCLKHLYLFKIHHIHHIYLLI